MVLYFLFYLWGGKLGENVVRKRERKLFDDVVGWVCG